MPTVVSTGQITIIDQNDAKTISTYLTANKPVQQIFTKDESNGYAPNNSTASGGTALVITPKIFVSGLSAATDLSNNTVQVYNRRWFRGAGGTSIFDGTTTTQDASNFVQNNGTTAISSPFTVSANGVTLTIDGNLKETSNNYPIYFEADYKDPTTQLVSKIFATIELSSVKTGTNAVYVSIRGNNVIEQATGSTKNSTAICADLVRAAGIEKTSLEYRWYEVTTGTALQIATGGSIANVATKYGISDTATTAIPVVGTLGANLPALNGATSYNSSGVGNGNTLTINETAVTDFAVYRVDVTDTVELKTYSTYFSIYDISDPYEVIINSTTGDKLLNGQGSTALTPRVFYGADEVTSLTGWTFDWTFFDKDGKLAGFVDVDGSASATAIYNNGAGRAISANTTGTSAVITFASISPTAAPTVVSGSMVKIVKDGIATYYEISAATQTTVTLRATALTTLNYVDYPAPSTTNQFAGGVIYLCTTRGARNTSGNTSITVRGEDIDGKGRIVCIANRP